jgi:hypothetical protein
VVKGIKVKGMDRKGWSIKAGLFELDKNGGYN